MNINYSLIFEILYILAVIGVSLRIIYDTKDTEKTLGYLMLVIFVPIVGIIFYFTLGVNYRKRKLYNKKLIQDAELESRLQDKIIIDAEELIHETDHKLKGNQKLINLLLNENNSPLSNNNKVEVLLNGEQKFPAVLKALRSAKDHIHLEYYIYADDDTGRSIEEILIQKAKEGVSVRFIYDDFGSRAIRRKMVPRLKAAGVKAIPFYRIWFMLGASRVNYRNHRKIIVIDGQTAFVGGTNVSNEYVNFSDQPDKLFWRDTHLKIQGAAVYSLQYIFLSDWNFCAEDDLKPDEKFFPPFTSDRNVGDKLVQIAYSGPDSDTPAIRHSMLQAINLAKNEVLITTPYFIPGESMLSAICIAARSGVKVKLLVPRESDSKLVNAASSFYYAGLMEAGVEIFLYKKGFVHSKTMVIDDCMGMVGTANMDIRSFDLNFEVNAIIYDEAIAQELKEAFQDDLKESERLDPERWKKRGQVVQFSQNLARLFSPIL